ncbi:Hypothetical protein R9X50_00406000 [Acrodontium crateriforme]|uniref:Uncharacterized protein n=1 Tax=Acrodontium crateriforme TaxID=150365 RepID=A0AAQ3M4L0_9PEZI|nr:Hypothetical protein R9X50_00406000 [Acrodontium crateriforme]
MVEPQMHTSFGPSGVLFSPTVRTDGTNYNLDMSFGGEIPFTHVNMEGPCWWNPSMDPGFDAENGGTHNVVELRRSSNSDSFEVSENANKQNHDSAMTGIPDHDGKHEHSSPPPTDLVARLEALEQQCGMLQTQSTTEAKINEGRVESVRTRQQHLEHLAKQQSDDISRVKILVKQENRRSEATLSTALRAESKVDQLVASQTEVFQKLLNSVNHDSRQTDRQVDEVEKTLENSCNRIESLEFRLEANETKFQAYQEDISRYRQQTQTQLASLEAQIEDIVSRHRRTMEQANEGLMKHDDLLQAFAMLVERAMSKDLTQSERDSIRKFMN